MLESFRSKKILLIVAHPDDELLGLGATMNMLINKYNVFVKVIILGEGITSRDSVRDVQSRSSELEIHKSNCYDAQKAIGYQELSLYDFPDNRFDTVPLIEIIKVIETEKLKFQPDIIFTHHGGDVNIDHQKTFEAVITACRPMESETVKMIVTFETPSGTEWRVPSDPRHFLPNMFVSVTSVNIDAKIKGMESYQFEKRNYPHPRSPLALRIQAQRWGISVGVDYAEAFCIIRNVC